MTRAWLLIVLVACGGSNVTPSDAAPPDVPPAVDPPPFRCDFAECSDGFARTCGDEPQSLDCTAFGAACGGPFTDTDSGKPFTWCNCGTLGESEGFCLGGRFGVTCFDGLGGLTDCGVGFICAERPNGPFGIGCDCNNFADGICPATACSSDPDCAQCTPSCAGRQCGDNGCGGECGQCDLGDECTPTGQCTTVCVPNCTGKQCGDDGCNGSCGTCAAGATCNSDGTCAGPCVPDCTGKTCGSDGCKGSCGTCTDGLECRTNDQCGCPFFQTISYKFTIAPQAGFPANFSFLVLNLKHTDLDGRIDRDGTALGFRASDKQTFTMRRSGCRPNIEIKLEYALSGKSCESTQTFTDRTDFTIPPPIINADGSCTAPPL